MKTRILIGPVCALMGLLASPVALGTTIVFDGAYNDTAMANVAARRASACSGSDCSALLINTQQGNASLTVAAGIANSNLAYYDSFDRRFYSHVNVYWEGSSGYGGLGVEAGQNQADCVGASNSMQGSCSGWRYDEILFLNFGSEVNFVRARFNGINSDFLDAGADFDFFIGDGSNNWSRIINDAAPSGPDFITVDAIGQYFAVVADDGLDVGYLESLTVRLIPEPGVLALFAVGLLGFGFATRRKT